MPNKFNLGDTVKVKAIITPFKGWEKKKGYFREWQRHKKLLQGIIVGRRFVQNGIISRQYDYTSFCPQEYIECYLVAFDLHKNPAYVLPDDIEK